MTTKTKADKADLDKLQAQIIAYNDMISMITDKRWKLQKKFNALEETYLEKKYG